MNDNETVREVCAEIGDDDGGCYFPLSERRQMIEYCERCNRCHDDGLRNDEECFYYGEPNGCNHPNHGYGVIVDKYSDARLIAAAPELLAFAAAYYERNKKNAVKVNPSNGDKYQDGLMVMCKQALVKAGMMDEGEVWKEAK